MPDPDLTSNNCDGETSTVQLGTDLASAVPNKRLGLVKHDKRTIVNDDALLPPDNGGDLPGGLKVYLCSEEPEQPYEARSNGNPGTASGVPPAAGGSVQTPAPVGTASANALRVRRNEDGSACGLLVSPPKFSAAGNWPRVDIIDNPAPGEASLTLDGDKIATIRLDNPDTVPRLFRVKGRFSMITHMVASNADTLLELIYRTRLNNHATNHLFVGGPEVFVGGGQLNSRVVTMTHPEGDFEGFPINDQRDFLDEVILPPGITRYLHYYTSTIRSRNVFTAAGTNPDRGVNIVGVSIEEIYAVGGA